MNFPGYYHRYLLNYNSTGISLTESYYNNTLHFNGTLPSLQPGQGIEVMLGMELWAMVKEVASTGFGIPSGYYFATTSIPGVSIPGGIIYNATSTIGIPSSVTILTFPVIGNVTYTQLSTSLYFYIYRNASQIRPSIVNMSFSGSSGTASFAIVRVVNVTRVLTLAQNGQVGVEDIVTVQNNDTSPITSMQLTNPASGQFQIAAGVIRPIYISLSSGVVNVASNTQPLPVEPNDKATFKLFYTLPLNAITRTSSGIQVNISKGALTYPSFYGTYKVEASFPVGSKVNFLTQNQFSNAASFPPVLLVVEPPAGLQLRPVLSVALVAAVMFITVFMIYIYRNRGGPEAEVDSILYEKRRTIAWLVEDIRFRGEGFAPYAYFTEERKQYEESRNRLNVRINALKDIAKKDKSYRQAVERLVAEDAKLEQIYKESRQILEDKLAGKLSEKDFRERIRSFQEKLPDV